MDTLNYQQIQQLPAVDTYSLVWNYINSFIFSPKVFLLILAIFFLMESIKYFSENSKYSFELNKKLYGVLTFVFLILLNILFNGFTTIKNFSIELFVIVSPVFVIYNIVLKQFGEWLRCKVQKMFPIEDKINN